MIENYLNKNVVIEEKLFYFPSTIKRKTANIVNNKTEGIITAIDDNFVELDNTMLISRKFIYRITLK